MPSSQFLTGMLHAASEYPDRLAVIVGNESLSFTALRAQSAVFADQLRALGLMPGQRVSFYAEQTAVLVAAAGGALMADAVFTGMHHAFTAQRYARHLADSDAAIVVTDRPEAVLAESPWFNVGPQRDGLHLLIHPDLARGAPRRFDLGAIFYTSGSSGNPKGAAIRTEAMSAAQQAVAAYLGIDSTDVVMSFATLGSDFGFYNSFIPPNTGATAVIETTLPGPDGSIFDRMEALSVTGLHVFPNVLHSLVEAATADRVYHGLRYICSTGQAFPIALLSRLRNIFPAARILSSYGMTECKRIAFLPDDELDHATGSVGRLLTELRGYLLDGAGRPLDGANQIGELALAGPLLMEGYWKDADDDGRTIVRGAFGEDRILLTGDMFRRDERDRLWFVGRKDEVFTRRGFQVDPREIERAVLTVPGIIDALVLPIAHPVEGHVPGLIAIGLPGLEPQIQKVCTANLERHMWPDRYLILDHMPREVSGKPARQKLREMLSSPPNIQEQEGA